MVLIIDLCQHATMARCLKTMQPLVKILQPLKLLLKLLLKQPLKLLLKLNLKLPLKLHLSLQHGDDMILKRMKRRHLRDDAIAFCQEARKLRPDMTFGADIIAGFPTESDAMFDNALRLVNECDLTWLHVFPYSARAGTPAARMPAVNGKIIKERAARLRAAGAEQVDKHLTAQIGRTHHVLMENPHMGRTEQFTETVFDEPQAEGSIVSTRITGLRDGQLIGTALLG